MFYLTLDAIKLLSFLKLSKSKQKFINWYKQLKRMNILYNLSNYNKLYDYNYDQILFKLTFSIV